MLTIWEQADDHMFQPLVSEERLLGVACIDVRLETLKNNFLADFRLSNTGFAYVLDREGGIIYHPEFLPQKVIPRRDVPDQHHNGCRN